jgi:sec-independent protein translocase protein TatA
MFGLRLPELVLILLAVILLFGGSKLPALGKGLGESVRSFRKALRESKDEEGGDSSTTSSSKDTTAK